MTPEQLAIARKLIRHWRWQWMLGMEASWEHVPRGAGGQVWRPRRARVHDLGGVSNDWERMVVCASAVPPGSVPAIGDPATDGCIAHLAMDAHGCHLWAVLDGDTYFINRTHPDTPTRTFQVASGLCLGSAWGEALLAAAAAGR